MYKRLSEYSGETLSVGSDENADQINLKDALGLMKEYGGMSFNHGLLRVTTFTDSIKWKLNVKDFTENLDGDFDVFAFDWLGRVFAITAKDETIQLDSATGDILEIPYGIDHFFEQGLYEDENDLLASEFFKVWQEASNRTKLGFNECVGYITPLYLGGDDEIENLEVCDMEVFWEINIQLMTQLNG